jgi:uncharacterized small protein (DUF1192 family)
MTTEERAALLGDELTRLIEAYIQTPNRETLGNFSAALINRCASMAAAAVISLHERVEELEAQIAATEAERG